MSLKKSGRPSQSQVAPPRLFKFNHATQSALLCPPQTPLTLISPRYRDLSECVASRLEHVQSAEIVPYRAKQLQLHDHGRCFRTPISRATSNIITSLHLHYKTALGPPSCLRAGLHYTPCSVSHSSAYEFGCQSTHVVCQYQDVILARVAFLLAEHLCNGISYISIS